MFAKRNFCIRGWAVPFLFFLLVGFVALGLPLPCRADALEDAARSLARKVATAAHENHSPAVFEPNRPAAPDPLADRIRESFIDELKKNGITISQESSFPVVRLFFEETPARVLLVAVLAGSSGDQVRMSELPRSALSAAERVSAGLHLRKELIWQQAEPILDAMEHTSESEKQSFLLILERRSLLLYRNERTQWVLRDSVPVSYPGKPVRDPRGELWLSAGHEDQVRVVVPGKVCDARMTDQIALSCQEGSAAWRESMFLVSPCNRQMWPLGTEAGDRSVPDRLVLGNPSLPGGGPSVTELDFPGPVLSIAGGQGFQADAAVVFNLATGNYEVYRITLVCDR